MFLCYNSSYNRYNHSIFSRAKILSELIKKLLHREARNRISAIGQPWSDIIPNREISAHENDRRVISARITRICSGRRAPWGAANATRHKCQYICGRQYITIVVRERADRFRPPSDIVISRSTWIDEYAWRVDEF